jgi:hypothetical protein
MKTTITLTSLSVVMISALVLLSASASAQVVAYHHRSTAFGDYAAGASELVRAQGAFLRDEAAAAENWVQVAAARDDLLYQRAERYYQAKQMELEYMKQRAQANREQAQAESAAETAAAQRLVESARLGAVQWPAALTLPRFAESMSLIESILRNWTPAGATSESYRRALVTEAGVLRTRISSDRSIDFLSRVEAVRALTRLQTAAAIPAEGPSAQVAMR